MNDFLEPISDADIWKLIDEFSQSDFATLRIAAAALRQQKAKIEELEDERMDAAMLGQYRIWHAQAEEKIRKLTALIDKDTLEIDRLANALKELKSNEPY